MQESPALKVTVSDWKPARALLSEFVAAHPELGLKFSENTYRNFCRAFSRRLLADDVLRQPHARATIIGNVNTFDAATFDLISKGIR